jgi:hypothetical protein
MLDADFSFLSSHLQVPLPTIRCDPTEESELDHRHLDLIFSVVQGAYISTKMQDLQVELQIR